MSRVQDMCIDTLLCGNSILQYVMIPSFMLFDQHQVWRRSCVQSIHQNLLKRVHDTLEIIGWLCVLSFNCARNRLSCLWHEFLNSIGMLEVDEILEPVGRRRNKANDLVWACVIHLHDKPYSIQIQSRKVDLEVERSPFWELLDFIWHDKIPSSEWNMHHCIWHFIITLVDLFFLEFDNREQSALSSKLHGHRMISMPACIAVRYSLWNSSMSMSLPQTT